MGRKDREHRERVIAGLEKPIRHGNISGLQRTGIKLFSRKKVLETLKNAPTEEQIEALDNTAGKDEPSKLKRAIMLKAAKEMDKGIKKFKKQGKEVTVDGLLEEVKTTPGFLKMCENVGLNYEWFEQLAEERMKIYGLI